MSAVRKSKILSALKGVEERMLGVKFFRGAVHLAGGRELGEICWVLTTETIVPPSSMQGGDGRTDPRKIMERQVNVEAHIYGEDIAHVEEIQEKLVQSLREFAWGWVGFSDVEWFVDGAIDEKGAGMMVLLTFVLPIVEKKTIRAAVTSTPISGDIV